MKWGVKYLNFNRFCHVGQKKNQQQEKKNTTHLLSVNLWSQLMALEEKLQGWKFLLASRELDQPGSMFEFFALPGASPFPPVVVL